MAKATQDTVLDQSVSAEPVKSFFVDMLTRDISLSDAILDLLDNCVDGIIRTTGTPEADQPYEGYRAAITFDSKQFTLEDNCGGIPWALHEYAWRLGNPDRTRTATSSTVGVYGIGMKRALFKLAQSCVISTQHKNDRYAVDISKEWMSKEREWEIPVRKIDEKRNEDGTTITVTSLRDNVAQIFSKDAYAFEAELRQRIETHYAFIINKGFEVHLNGQPLSPKPISLRIELGTKGPNVLPFVFSLEENKVSAFLVVGLTHPIPSEEETEAEQEVTKYSSLDAGWTVVCNDRAVVYCDRTELTGWGEAGVPRFHNQFIAISGIVEFRSKDPSLLPTTTTKRGIDASSQLFLKVKNKMREGTELFTDFTNKWKGRELVHKIQERLRSAKLLNLQELRDFAKSNLKMASVRSIDHAKQFKPNLPLPPPVESDRKRICFTRTIGEIAAVSRFLSGETGLPPKEVGERCFDYVAKEGKKR